MMSTSRCCRRRHACPTSSVTTEVDHRLWPERHIAGLGYPSVVARLAIQVSVSFIATRRIGDPHSNDFYTSEWGTLGAAMVNPIDGDESLIVVSMAPVPTPSRASRARRVAESASAQCTA